MTQRAGRGRADSTSCALASLSQRTPKRTATTRHSTADQFPEGLNSLRAADRVWASIEW